MVRTVNKIIYSLAQNRKRISFQVMFIAGCDLLTTFVAGCELSRSIAAHIFKYHSKILYFITHSDDRKFSKLS